MSENTLTKIIIGEPVCQGGNMKSARHLFVAIILIAGISIADDSKRPTVEVRGESRTNCPSSIPVQIAAPLREWRAAATEAQFLRAELWVGGGGKAVAVCIYTAWGGEFKIDKPLSRDHDSCETYVEQGGTGGILCE